MKRATVIGAGLTGLSAAYTLERAGVAVTVYEAGYTVGGHARSESMRGVPYEPHGAHIFHTNDDAVWALASSLVRFLPYRHRVLTDVEGSMFSWPIQTDELHRLDAYGRIQAEVAALPLTIDTTNFETWCVSQMGETLYGLFIAGYTEKQWGCPPSRLSAEIGPKRVELRTDGCRDLFRDRFQGWPAHGYGSLADALAADVELRLGSTVSHGDLGWVAAAGEPVIVTVPLDAFYADRFGPLGWRGVALAAEWHPGVRFHQEAMVVNRPSLSVGHTRTIETKHVLGPTDLRGTMVMYEYPGAAAKHYPVPDAVGAHRGLQRSYEAILRSDERNPLIPAGRLARYTYINMDQAMADGIAAAARVLELVSQR